MHFDDNRSIESNDGDEMPTEGVNRVIDNRDQREEAANGGEDPIAPAAAGIFCLNCENASLIYSFKEMSLRVFR